MKAQIQLEYRLVAKKGEGTFSEVLKAQCIKNGKYVAIKCMKNHFDSLDQVNNLREIQALRRLSPHQHIIKLLEVLYDQPTGRLALVFELMDMNIYELIRGRRHYVAEERVKSYLYQLMKSMDHMHRNGIFHRDIKPENILIMDDCLKLADFGSCRGIYSKQPYTEYISTRWYRAPECLLTDGYYNYKMDMWGVGCVMFEIVALYPLFPGNNELDQIQKIHAIMGTPPPDLLAKLKKRSNHAANFDFPPCEGTGLTKMLAHVSPECADLIGKLLAYNPDERLSARQALRHPYFRELRDQEKRAKAAMQPDTAGSYLTMDTDRGHQAVVAQALPSDALAPAGSCGSELQVEGVHGAALSFTSMRISNGAAAQAAAGDHGKSLPAITGSSMKVHGHITAGPGQQQIATHIAHHQQQHAQQSLPQQQLLPMQQQMSQPTQQCLADRHQGLQIAGAGTLRDKEGSLALLPEASSTSTAVHVPSLSLNPQASMDSIWEENSDVLLGGPGPIAVAAAAAGLAACGGGGGGQLLPPLVSKASSNNMASGSHVAARRGGYLGQQAARNHHQQHQQHIQQAAATYKAAAAGGSVHHNLGSHAHGPQHQLSGAKAGMLVGQQSSVRLNKHGSIGNSLQPPGSLASSTTNVTSMQVTGGASKYSRAVGGSSSVPGGAAPTGKKHAGSYVSPYAQRR